MNVIIYGVIMPLVYVNTGIPVLLAWKRFMSFYYCENNIAIFLLLWNILSLYHIIDQRKFVYYQEHT